MRDRMVVFGANTSSSRLNEVWALSLVGTPAWTQLTPTGTPPTARWGHSVIYDPVADRMVMFGGNSVSTAFNDTWALSLAGTPAWTQLAPTGTPPSGRWVHTAIFDIARTRMVVLGGYDGSNNLNDLWQLKLVGTPAWTKLSPGGTAQSPRWGQPSIYDPTRDRMVLFGGNTGVVDLNDASAVRLSGSTSWTQLTPSVGMLSARAQSAAVYDPVRDRMLLSFGGVGPAFYDDIGAFPLDGIHPPFTLATSGALPPRRSGHSAIYDPVRDRIVVFGGMTPPAALLADVWELSLAGTPTWTQLSPSGTPPAARVSHNAIYDPVRDRMILFGGTTLDGSNNDVWALSLSGSPAWTQLATIGTPPSPRTESAAIYDPIRDRMVVSGGRLDGFTWYSDLRGLLLSGTPLWHFVGTNIQTVAGHSAVYDSIHDRMVLFGGFTGGSVSQACWQRGCRAGSCDRSSRARWRQERTLYAGIAG